VKLRLAVLVLASALCAPAAAQNMPMSALAPADEYFGHYKISVLGIANMIRDVGRRLEDGRDAGSMIDGPLSLVADAIRDWEHAYPRDPWIAKDLLALEVVYLRAQAPEAMTLARRTEAWLVRDYPDAAATQTGRRRLALALGENQDEAAGAPWERFAEQREPAPPRR
jgi:hypothetical protein